MTDTTLDAAPASAAPVSAGADVRDFVDLLKPRVMSLVVFTGFAGMWVAPGSLHPVIALVAILCLTIGAGAAGAINMWADRDIDAVMSRTRARPIPSGRVSADASLAFGVVLSIFSVLVMGLAVNWVAAAILAGANLFYVFVYTMWLKRRTPQNIVIGGAAGAFPPMIGWAAVTGDVSLASIVLFLIIFMWTPPHFWALSLYARDDYAAAKIPMLPVVAGERETKRQMLVYTVLLFPIGLMPTVLGVAGWPYFVGAFVLGALFIVAAVRVLREPGAAVKPAKQMFAYSVLYLFLIFTLLIADRFALALAVRPFGLPG